MDLAEIIYKQTEVGLIPKDWTVNSLNTLLNENPKYGVGASAVDFDYNLPTYLRITDIDEDGKLLPSGLKSVNHPESHNYFLKEGDVVLARTGASVGKSYKYDSVDGQLVFAGFLIKVSPNPSKLDSQYLKCFLNTTSYWNWVTVNSMRSGQPGINGNEYGSLPIPLPPTITEQKAIATALSDVDSLISSLDKLITKKKAIKQGAMQELLTPPHKGGIRLPGFSGEWEEITLGEIGQCIIGLTYSPTNVKDSGTLVLRSSNIQNGRFSSHDNVYVDCEIPEKLKVQENDILVCVRNGSRNLIGKSLKLSNELAGQTWGAFMSVYRSKFNDFVVHLFNSNVIQRQIEENLGATINQITNKTLNSFKVFIPKNVEEQKGIAKTLLDMDLEIETLENKKAKYQEIKQGMMQELLTGKTRLVWN
jgi:type I restriction enzyme S subunit